MSIELHKARVRAELKPRHEPYWAAPLAAGRYLGFRKISPERGVWTARLREEDTKGQRYKSLGTASSQFDFDEAKAAALRWFKTKDAGVSDKITTVADACRAYVADREREKGTDCAHDAKKRFERTVYGTPFGATPLHRLRAPAVKAWRDNLGLSKASANRTLTTLRAALNLAVSNRLVHFAAAREWKDVKPHKGADKRRNLFLDLAQRRALLAGARGATRDLIEAAALTGARAGELVNATVAQFDARLQTMRYTGKTGPRTVGLSPAAMSLFTRLAEGKLPDARLLVRDDGLPWAHSDWDELIRNAAAAAELPKGTCLYTLRHSFISQAISDGLPTLDVARMVGPSLMMIQKHYGHLVKDAAGERLAKVQML